MPDLIGHLRNLEGLPPREAFLSPPVHEATGGHGFAGSTACKQEVL